MGDKGSAAIGKQTSGYRTAYLGFSLASLSRSRDAATADRAAVLNAFYNNCAQSVVPTAVGLHHATATVAPAYGALLLGGLLLLTWRGARRVRRRPAGNDQSRYYKRSS